MSWCTSGVWLQDLPFIDNRHLGSIPHFQQFSYFYWNCQTTLWSHHLTSHVTVPTCALQKSNWIWAPLWLKKILIALKNVLLILDVLIKVRMHPIHSSIFNAEDSPNVYFLIHWSLDICKVPVRLNPRYYLTRKTHSLKRDRKGKAFISLNQLAFDHH